MPLLTEDSRWPAMDFSTQVSPTKTPESSVTDNIPYTVGFDLSSQRATKAVEFSVWLTFLFETGSHKAQAGLKLTYIAEINLKFLIPLPLLPKCQNYRCTLPCLVLSHTRDQTQGPVHAGHPCDYQVVSSAHFL